MGPARTFSWTPRGRLAACKPEALAVHLTSPHSLPAAWPWRVPCCTGEPRPGLKGGAAHRPLPPGGFGDKPCGQEGVLRALVKSQARALSTLGTISSPPLALVLWPWPREEPQCSYGPGGLCRLASAALSRPLRDVGLIHLQAGPHPGPSARSALPGLTPC